jgi:hypothetical protein
VAGREKALNAVEGRLPFVGQKVNTELCAGLGQRPAMADMFSVRSSRRASSKPASVSNVSLTVSAEKTWIPTVLRWAISVWVTSPVTIVGSV